MLEYGLKMHVNEIQKYIKQAVFRENLTIEESERAFQIIMNGGATPAEMAALLTALKMKGETPAEIIGAAMIMRDKATKIKVPPKLADIAMDTCGTGGDYSGTLNISTAVAFILAGCGVPIAKHGNRAISSRSGSADVLAELDVNIDATPETSQKCLEKAGICFMLAPTYHKAMRHVMPVRQELGFRTIFNLLGPLTNPARVKRQIVGVYSREVMPIYAEALLGLGVERAWVVASRDELDEISIADETYVISIENGQTESFTVTPEEAGLPRADLKELEGGDAQYNSMEIRSLLGGKKSPYRDVVLLNAAAGLIVAGLVNELKEGVSYAADSIDSGKAAKVLQKLVEASNE